VQKKTITTQGMGAFGNMGNILIGKQGDGAGKTISSPNINMTVVKVDQQLGQFYDDYHCSNYDLIITFLGHHILLN